LSETLAGSQCSADADHEGGKREGSGGVYKVFHHGSSIGTAKTEEQAIALIKAHVSAPIRRVEVY